MLGLGLTEILFLLVLGAFLAIQYGKPKHKNLPPGPRRLPILGNIFQLTNNAPRKMYEWAKQYGKMYSMQLGTHEAIVINDVKLIKEMLFDANFSSRPYSPINELFSGGPHGIIFTNGATWEEQRRWSLRKLRDYGFGKTSMEGIIMDEVNEALDQFKKSGGKYILTKEIFDLAVLNALWTLLNGERLSQNDPKIRQVLDTFHKIIPVISESGLGFAPWLKYIFPSAMKQIEEASDGVMKISRDAVANHFDTHQEGESRDFIDEYINEIKNTNDSKSSFYQQIGRKNLEGTVSDFIQAGSETTSNTLIWTLIYLSQWPEVQKKLHAELDAVVGDSRPVALSDKPNLPYLEATIYETLRHSALVAGGVQHGCMADKEVGGFTIPKGAWVLTNIYYVHHDPAIWGDPENFRPERFLSPDGKKAVRHEALIPFQMGRRQCVGESLARDSLFLFTGNIYQQFSIDRLEKGEPEHVNGLFLAAKDYHFRFQSRV